jgi:F-type H+-transporting ATPase subunit gamma
VAGGQERELRRRIRSVSATKKITRAMELIAASQMVRAQGRLAGAHPYVEGIGRVLAVTAADAAGASRFLGEPSSVRRALIVAIVSDRGLAGGYNSAVLRATLRYVRAEEEASGTAFELVTVGRKAQSFFRFNDRPISKAFTRMTDRPRFEDARQVASVFVGPFLTGELDRVELVSTRFLSAGVQRVERRQVLPLPAPRPSSSAAAEAASEHETGELSSTVGRYEFEPEAEDLLRLLVPQYAEAVVYQALLEASAAEHTARQRAMSAATENAEELITTYRRAMNRARQEAITTEIMEIVGGAEALRQAGSQERGVEMLALHNEERTA